jgi:hypothetical protein
VPAPPEGAFQHNMVADACGYTQTGGRVSAY